MSMTTAKTLLAAACTTAGLGMAALPAQAGKTIDAIKARGQLVCGVNTGLAGFSAADSQGNWSGMDVDVCKAIAAAMLKTDTTKSSVSAVFKQMSVPVEASASKGP